nr:unnamed protein product [Meloidogyne enterolobii]
MPGMETLPFGHRNNNLISAGQRPQQKRPITSTTPPPTTIDLNLQDLPGSSGWTETDYRNRYCS